MVNIVFFSRLRFARKNVPFKPCTNITMFFFNRKQNIDFILPKKRKMFYNTQKGPIHK